MGRPGVLLLAVACCAGAPTKKPSAAAAPVVSSFCTENAAKQKAVDPTGRCVCECGGGLEGGAPCAFVTIKGRLHGGDSWCPTGMETP